jgi:hypothetical protein
VYQLVWVRQLLLVVGTTTGAVSTVLSVFMAGLGIGAWRFGAVADRSRSPLKLYGYLELGIGLYALLLPALLEAATSPYVSLARALGGHAVAPAPRWGRWRPRPRRCASRSRRPRGRSSGGRS